MDVNVLRTLFLLVLMHLGSPNAAKEIIKLSLVHSWAQKLGVELWNCAELVTRRQKVQESYKQAQVEGRDGGQLVQEITADIKDMMDTKISAVKRIMDSAENAAMEYQDEVIVGDYKFYNAKIIRPAGENITNEMEEVVLNPNKHFYNNPVNTSFSAVHVPTNVFEGAKDILKAMKWSEKLDRIFISNFNNDPSLSWQYFGSSLGFMRQFPAIQWKTDTTDMYDCRTRSWYIEAANSPKDIIILVDNSGSMTGMRKEIARHTVSNILDTLGNNDFVNVFNFSDSINEVVPCFRDILVQATLANIRELKLGMEDLFTDQIANFSLALNTAFELLEMYREEKRGACCNQAIMLVTDGAPYNYKEIFERYNWKDRNKMPVRVFTYLIGREITDVREVKWMACANQGFFVHLQTKAEVREKVLAYVPVMSRPMVLWKKDHPTIWTPVYADREDPKMTDWLWENEECAEQKEVIWSYRKDKKNFVSHEEQDRRYIRKMKRMQNQYGDPRKYKLMTSVSMPVFDRRENANITERIMINEAIWVEKTRESRIANLLGVAGTDVPIEDFKKLMMPHLLGVNGYAFIVNNNGHILTHPDLRPVFQGILKPSYNSVDMAEVELPDDDNEPRDPSAELRMFRDSVINQSSGTSVLRVKYHMDNMKRASTMTRRYYYRGIENTPFTLVITIPEPYGSYRVNGIEEIGMHRTHNKKGTSIQNYFTDNNKWKIHPEWVYCTYRYDADEEHQFADPESELLHFLNKSLQPGWRWPLNRTFPPPEMVNTSVGKKDKLDRDSYFCDRKLFLSLIFDAKVTEWFSKNFSSSTEEKKKEFKQRFGLTVAFVATHSGLTRWLDLADDDVEPHFSDIHNRAIDEVWYKRAVEQHFVDPESFVYSVPFDASENEKNLVTASHAVFHTSGIRKAPAAVVGLQFHHSALHAHFFNITTSCLEMSNCDKQATCASDDMACYVLDNNGFVVVSESQNDTGRFFGDIRGSIMEQMVNEKIYKRIHLYDYQAVCFEGDKEVSTASILSKPLNHMKWLVEWMLSNFMWSLVQIGLPSFCFGEKVHAADSDDGVYVFDEESDRDEPPLEEEEEENGHTNKMKDKILFEELMINRTRPMPCDMEVDLYKLEDRFDKDRKSNGCTRPFVVQNIPHSNLVLVVVYTLCNPNEHVLSVTPTEVSYNASLACHKTNITSLPRKRPGSCINWHEDESKIQICGAGAGSILVWIPGLLCLLAAILITAH